MLGYNKILEKLDSLDKELNKIEVRNDVLDSKFDNLLNQLNKPSYSPSSSKVIAKPKPNDKYTLIDEDHNYIGQFNTLAKMANKLNISLSRIYNHLDHDTNIVDLSGEVKYKRDFIKVSLVDRNGKVKRVHEYSSVRDAANSLNITPKTLYNHKRANEIIIPVNTPKKGTNASAIPVKAELLNDINQVSQSLNYDSLSQAIKDLDITWATLYKYLDKDANTVAIPIELTSKSIKPQLFHIEG